MANLSDLIKKQREQASGKSQAESHAGGGSPNGAGAADGERIKSPTAGARLSFMAKAQVAAAAKPDSTPPTEPASNPEPARQDSLDSLAALSASTDMGGPVAKAKPEFDFAVDHVDATAPIRDIPAELLEKHKEFVDLLDSMYSNANEPEILSQVCVNIMIELQNHPEMEPMLADKDLRTMVIAARNSMGLARIRKTEKGRSKGTTASRSKKAQNADEILSSLGIDLGDLG